MDNDSVFINTINSESNSNKQGGSQIYKKKERTIEVQNFTCPNPVCGKVFTSPLKTENVSSRNQKKYDACPYCLTEIVIEASPTCTEEDKHKPENIEEPPQFGPSETAPATPKTSECPYHLGYLSKRSPKDKIPESCMMCENIVQCMLKNITK
ncbi:MAG: hypothetical protein QW840_02995 [Candidatus Bathyarchaeia archaeon]